jgi:hypothetical protein
MGYRKIDPRTKAAAIKAMRKAVEDNGQSIYAAARELSAKYGIGANTLHKYFVDSRPAAESETDIVEHDSGRTPATVDSAVIAASDNGSSTNDNSTHHLATADRLSAEFTGTLEKLSAEFVAHLQEAALDDLIRRMRELRDGLRN